MKSTVHRRRVLMNPAPERVLYQVEQSRNRAAFFGNRSLDRSSEPIPAREIGANEANRRSIRPALIRPSRRTRNPKIGANEAKIGGTARSPNRRPSRPGRQATPARKACSRANEAKPRFCGKYLVNKRLGLTNGLRPRRERTQFEPDRRGGPGESGGGRAAGYRRERSQNRPRPPGRFIGRTAAQGRHVPARTNPKSPGRREDDERPFRVAQVPFPRREGRVTMPPLVRMEGDGPRARIAPRNPIMRSAWREDQG
jgi:hypothetical protein